MSQTNRELLKSIVDLAAMLHKDGVFQTHLRGVLLTKSSKGLPYTYTLQATDGFKGMSLELVGSIGGEIPLQGILIPADSLKQLGATYKHIKKDKYSEVDLSFDASCGKFEVFFGSSRTSVPVLSEHSYPNLGQALRANEGEEVCFNLDYLLQIAAGMGLSKGKRQIVLRLPAKGQWHNSIEVLPYNQHDFAHLRAVLMPLKPRGA